MELDGGGNEQILVGVAVELELSSLLVEVLNLNPLLVPGVLEHLDSLRSTVDRVVVAQGTVDQKRDQPADEVVQVEDLHSVLWDFRTHRTDKAGEVGDHAQQIRDHGPPVGAKPVVHVPCSELVCVAMVDADIALADDEVVCSDDTRDTGEEDGIGRERGGELGGGGHEVPRADGDGDCRADVGATSDVDELRDQGGHVGTGTDGVGGDVCSQLCEGEGGGNQEHSRTIALVVVVQKPVQDIQRIPVVHVVHVEG